MRRRLAAIATTMFLGGWLLPFGIDPPGWVDPFVVLGKMMLFIFFFIWVRATLPRLRYDQLMSFGWKVLLPLATPQRPRDRDRRGGDRLIDALPWDPGRRRASRSCARPSPGGAGGAYRAFGETLRGLKTTFARIVEGADDDPVPRGEGPGLPALPRAPPAAPLRGHGPGEVRRLLAVRRRLPGRLHPRRRRREHAREPRVAPASATPRSTRSTCRAASSAATARSRARSTRSRWATTTRCPTTTAPTSSSPRRCCSPSRFERTPLRARGRVASGAAMAAVFFFIAAHRRHRRRRSASSTLRNPFYAVLALVFHLLSLAALFLLLRAEFVAAAQVVVYAGAVMVLYVFVVAYVGGAGRPSLRRAGGPRPARGRRRLRAGRCSSSCHRDARLGPEGDRLRGRALPRRLRPPGADRRAAADEVPAALRGRVVPAARSPPSAPSCWPAGAAGLESEDEERRRLRIADLVRRAAGHGHDGRGRRRRAGRAGATATPSAGR